jgi:hypothetical protein
MPQGYFPKNSKAEDTMRCYKHTRRRRHTRLGAPTKLEVIWKEEKESAFQNGILLLKGRDDKN